MSEVEIRKGSTSYWESGLVLFACGRVLEASFDIAGKGPAIAVVEPCRRGCSVPAYAIKAWRLDDAFVRVSGSWEEHYLMDGLRTLLDDAGVVAGDHYLFWIEFK